MRRLRKKRRFVASLCLRPWTWLRRASAGFQPLLFRSKYTSTDHPSAASSFPALFPSEQKDACSFQVVYSPPGPSTETSRKPRDPIPRPRSPSSLLFSNNPPLLKSDQSSPKRFSLSSTPIVRRLVHCMEGRQGLGMLWWRCRGGGEGRKEEISTVGRKEAERKGGGKRREIGRVFCSLQSPQIQLDFTLVAPPARLAFFELLTASSCSGSGELSSSSKRSTARPHRSARGHLLCPRHPVIACPRRRLWCAFHLVGSEAVVGEDVRS